MDLSRQAGRVDHHELLRARESLLSNSGNGRDGSQCSRGGQGNEKDSDLRHYSITSSARARSASGTFNPSFFAVLMLMTSSNLVGNWAGKSAGFVPRKIRST